MKDEEDGTEEKVERTEKAETDEGQMNEKDEESVSEDEEWNGGLFMFPGNNIRSRYKGIILVIWCDPACTIYNGTLKTIILLKILKMSYFPFFSAV